MVERGRLEGRRSASALGRLFYGVAETLRMIRFEHSLFALPFAFLGMLLAARGLPDVWTIAWIVVCMVGARSAAMTCNRILDLPYDRRNPRTRDRSLPAGRLSLPFAWGFLAVSVGVFVLGAGMLNRTCLLLSPVALVIVLGYSASKRFTIATHLWLGVSLSMAPAGAWIAVRNDLPAEARWLAMAVVLWVAGFDILYACQDVEFDRQVGLRSLPAAVGIGPALAVSAVLHAAMLGALAATAVAGRLGLPFWAGIAAAAAILAYGHFIVRPADLSRLETAFFGTNAAVGLVLLGATAFEVALA